MALVLLEAEELRDLLGVADALERAHVLAGRGDERAVHAGVDAHHGVHDDVVDGQADRLDLATVRHEEVPPHQRRVDDAVHVAPWDRLGLVDDEGPLDDGLGLVPGPLVVIDEVEAVVVGEVRVDAVTGEAAAQAVAAVALDRHGADGRLAAHAARPTRRRCP